MNQVIDINRFSALIKLNLAAGQKGFLLATSGFFGFVFIFSFFVARNNPAGLSMMHNVFYYIFLYGGGIAMAGTAFHMLNTRTKSISYISLPASTTEKFLVSWLLTGIGWLIVAMVLYPLFAILVNGFWSVILDFRYEIFNPFTMIADRFTKADPFLPYITVHAAFFLGAAAFMHYAIPKTLLAGFIVQSIFTFVSVVTMLILFKSITPEAGTNMVMFDSEKVSRFNELSTLVAKLVFVYILPVIFYTAAFFKLKEREV
jgi:hypothetical protein